jgi:hypothetical protein
MARSSFQPRDTSLLRAARMTADGERMPPSGWGISSGHIKQIWSMRNPAKLSALTEARLVTG